MEEDLLEKEFLPLIEMSFKNISSDDPLIALHDGKLVAFKNIGESVDLETFEYKGSYIHDNKLIDVFLDRNGHELAVIEHEPYEFILKRGREVILINAFYLSPVKIYSDLSDEVVTIDLKELLEFKIKPIEEYFDMAYKKLKEEYYKFFSKYIV
jgi:hypothetical protein